MDPGGQCSVIGRTPVCVKLSQGIGHIPGDVGRGMAQTAPTLATWMGGWEDGQVSGEIDKLMDGWVGRGMDVEVMD